MTVTVVAMVAAAPPLIAQTAETAGAGSVLFLNSSPLGAEVVFDGTVVGRTPLLLEEAAPGEHRIELVKLGFLPTSQTVTLEADAVENISIRLEPATYVTQFSGSEVISPDGRFARNDATVNLTAGTYQLSTVGTALKIEPVYPLEGARIATMILTPALALLTAVSAAEDYLSPNTFSLRPSTSTVTSFALTVASAGFLIGLSADRTRYLQPTAITRYQGRMTATEAERAFQAGEEALSAGNLITAVDNYSQLLTDAPESERLPGALYKTARVYSVAGEDELALPLFRRLVTDYPVAEYYDAALMEIAEIRASAGEYDSARAAIARMVFASPLFTREEVAEYRTRIDQREAEAQR